MNTIMYIKGSPRTERSHSRQIARAFISALQSKDPELRVDERDIFTMNLPSFDGLTIKGKYNIMHGREYTPAELEAWSAVEAIIEDFKSVDAYVFAVPMWNLGLPYRLKHYIDIVTQPTYTFGINENGYFGMLGDKKAFVAYSSGGVFPDEGNPLETWNFQSSYLRTWFSFVGITKVQEVFSRGMLMDGGPQAKEQAIALAERIAVDF
ncbi:MAG: NAD(P)H-dependent oxidoreductase [Proteobacteria bacterium]|nr:NAD(P)H-dependent oxidoreductase [Pseudomonadota bacterium]MBU1611791.1 NAD(P)H-dependent oxidoreductase [Pseudomonadota bacterium]